MPSPRTFATVLAGVTPFVMPILGQRHSIAMMLRHSQQYAAPGLGLPAESVGAHRVFIDVLEDVERADDVELRFVWQCARVDLDERDFGELLARYGESAREQFGPGKGEVRECAVQAAKNEAVAQPTSRAIKVRLGSMLKGARRVVCCEYEPEAFVLYRRQVIEEGRLKVETVGCLGKRQEAITEISRSVAAIGARPRGAGKRCYAREAAFHDQRLSSPSYADSGNAAFREPGSRHFPGAVSCLSMAPAPTTVRADAYPVPNCGIYPYKTLGSGS